ncbi:MAG: hypothetical protein FJX23_10505, partial [Alphaproteobacteria bacterium]|nr:hypothetical protein [Alphaproteobacteria bacterium]
MKLYPVIFLLCLSACGVQGSLYRPEAAPAPEVKTSQTGQLLPASGKKPPRPSVQTGIYEDEMTSDPFLTMSPDGEYDIRDE